MPKDEIDKKVRDAARILDLEKLLDRKPKALSGGQRQRVAMGRAIVRSPKVFLMDEPLSNLDAKLRVQMRTEIAKLHHRLGTTIIYVTHDQTEAMTLGTRIVVMKDGVVQQVDTPQNLYDKPCNLFVAGFMGSPQMNFLDGVVAIQGETAYVKVADQQIELPPAKSKKLIEGKYDGKTVTIGIRPEDVDDSEMFVNVRSTSMSCWAPKCSCTSILQASRLPPGWMPVPRQDPGTRSRSALMWKRFMSLTKRRKR